MDDKVLAAMSVSSPRPSEPTTTHLPVVADGEGCLEILLARLRTSPGALTLVCFVMLVLGFALERIGLPLAWSRAAYIASALAGGFFTLRSTIRSLSKFRFDVNLLMLLAAIGAGAIGYVMEAAVLMFLFSLSNTLEVYTMGRTRRALHALLKLRPARALVRRDGREIEVEADAVRVGETVIVKPGEAIPVDGAVALGE